MASTHSRKARPSTRAPSLRAVPAVAQGALLAVFSLNLSTLHPAVGVDSSFRVALTEATRRRFDYGSDIVWPYGPLGFMGGPTALHRGMLVLATLYQVSVLVVLFTALVHQFRRLGLNAPTSTLVLLVAATGVALTDNIVPELVSLAIVLVLLTLWQSDDPALPRLSSWWVMAAAGLLAGAQLLVKVGPGVLAILAVGWFAVIERPRARNAAIAAASAIVGFAGGWFATGHSLGDLSPFVTTMRELSGGYNADQAFGPGTSAIAFAGAVSIGLAVLLALAVLHWCRSDRRAWRVVPPLAVTTVFLLKQGLVRWDDWHAVGTCVLISLMLPFLPWPRLFHRLSRWALPLAGLFAAAMLAVAAGGVRRLGTVWSDRVDAAAVVLSAGQQRAELARDAAALRASYAVPQTVVDALAGAEVHSEPWEVNAVWGYGFAWEPLPIIQSYSTYTAALDRLNAARYSATDGPSGVLFSTATVDGRVGPWESPDARLALTCNFEVVAQQGDWSALLRAGDVCGLRRPLGDVRVRAGDNVVVPTPSSPDSLVVARFDLPDDAVRDAVTTLARPLRFPRVDIDGVRHRLVVGTAPSAHLVRSPGRLGDRALPHGAIDQRSLSFANVGGSGEVVVRFEEIALRLP